MAWHSCRCVSPSRRRVHSTFLAPKQKKIFHKRKSNKSCLAKCWRILYTENNKRPNCHRRIPQIFVVCHCVIAPWTSISICNKKRDIHINSVYSLVIHVHTHTHIHFMWHRFFIKYTIYYCINCIKFRGISKWPTLCCMQHNTDWTHTHTPHCRILYINLLSKQHTNKTKTNKQNRNKKNLMGFRAWL